MGKISNALERKQGERAIKAKMIQPASHLTHESKSQESFDPKLVACSLPGSIDAENFKILKSQILFTNNGTRPKTIMITSAVPGEGKTFVATNLAVSIAQGINEHALLIDCDLRHPDAHKMLGYSNKDGLQEYLTGNKQLPDLLIRTRIDKLSLLTAGGLSPNPSELLSSAKMKEFFDEVKGRYHDRYIIIDSAPSHIMAEVGVLANYVDNIIFVVKAQKSSREIIKECIEKLGKEKIIGIVFNGHDKGGKSYNSYYKDYYKGK